jgi:hypothetical protein
MSVLNWSVFMGRVAFKGDVEVSDKECLDFRQTWKNGLYSGLSAREADLHFGMGLDEFSKLAPALRG